MHWDSDSQFRIALPSRPVVTDLVGRIEAESPDAAGRISFELVVRLQPVVWMVVLNLAFAIIGPWSTELFIEVYSWFWQPPLCLLAALWIGWRWPHKAVADAREIAPRWIEEIQNRLEGENGSTAAVA